MVCRSLLKGGNSKKKGELIEMFTDNPDCTVFLLNRAAGAYGLNLTMATHVLLLEPSWNPVWEAQAISRANRQGQKGPIHVMRFQCVGARLLLAAACRRRHLKPRRILRNGPLHRAMAWCSPQIAYHLLCVPQNTSCLLADTVEEQLHDLMVSAHVSGGERGAQLSDAANTQAAFATKEQTINETVMKVVNEHHIAKLLGDLDKMDTDDEDEE